MTWFRALTVQRQLLVGFSIPLFLLLIVGYVGYSSIDTLDAQSETVADIRATGVEIRDVSGLLQRAEFYEAEYLLTGDESYSASFDSVVAQIPEELAEVRDALTLEENIARFDELRPLIDLRVDDMTEVIDVFEAEGQQAGIAAFEAVDRSVDEQMDGVLDAMQAAQNELLEAEMATMTETAERNKWIILASAAAALAAAGVLPAGIGKAMSGVIRKRAEELNASAGSLASVSAQMGSNAQETSSQANVVAAAGEQVSHNVQTVATAMEEMTASVREISQSSADASQVAAEAVRTAEETNARVSALGVSSAEIGEVIEVITSIAEQTNLLALNATIEAARAGEAGKGFAVVAGEVKELAKQTAKATEEISSKIAAIQTDTGGAVDAIGQIGEVIGRIADMQNTIASAVEEQTVTTNEISRNINEAATGSAQIAENIVSVAQAAEQTAQGAAQTEQSAGQLREVAAGLQALVDGTAQDVVTSPRTEPSRGSDGASAPEPTSSPSYGTFESDLVGAGNGNH